MSLSKDTFSDAQKMTMPMHGGSMEAYGVGGGTNVFKNQNHRRNTSQSLVVTEAMLPQNVSHEHLGPMLPGS